MINTPDKIPSLFRMHEPGFPLSRIPAPGVYPLRNKLHYCHKSIKREYQCYTSRIMPELAILSQRDMLSSNKMTEEQI